MKALLAFIIMAAVIVTLIEVNERIKARKSKDESQKTADDCPPEQTAQDNCSACALMEVCEKEEKKKTGR